MRRSIQPALRSLRSSGFESGLEAASERTESRLFTTRRQSTLRDAHVFVNETRSRRFSTSRNVALARRVATQCAYSAQAALPIGRGAALRRRRRAHPKRAALLLRLMLACAPNGLPLNNRTSLEEILAALSIDDVGD